MQKYIFLIVLFLILKVKVDVFSQSDLSKLPLNNAEISSKSKYYGERLFWDEPKKVFSVSHFKDGKITDAEFYDINGNKVGSCSYIDNYPYTGTMLDHDLIWTKIIKKTYVKGFVVGTIIEYDIKFKELNKYPANNSPTMNAENYQNAYTKDGNPYNGKFVIEYSHIEYKDGLMHGLKKRFDFLTRDTFEITSYKNGKKDGIYQYLAIKDSVLAQGFYKDDQPFSGSFVDLNQFIFKTFNVYDEGVLVGINTYHFEYSSSKTNKITSYKLINTCSFKNGKPESGTFYDKTKYKFVSYIDGQLNKIYAINDRKMDTIEIQSFSNDKFHGLFKSKIDTWIDEYIVGYYKHGEPFNGELKDLKNRSIINQYVNGQQISSKDYSIGNPPNFYTIKNGKKDGLSQQRIRHSNDTTKYISVYRDDVPFEGQVCIKDEILTYKNGKLDGQCILLDGAKIKARRITTYKAGVITKAVNYNVFNTIDSISTTFIDGVLLNGQDIKYDDYSTILFTYKDGKITGDSTRFYHEKSYMIYKNGQRFEGIEYTKDNQYLGRFDFRTTYKDFKIVNMQGGAHKEWAHFEMNCDNQKCTLMDYSPFKYKTEINHIGNKSKNVTTYQNQNLISSGTLKNDFLDEGSFTFVNYASRFDKKLENWTRIIVNINKLSTNVTVFRDNQRFAENFKIRKKLDISFPVFGLHDAITFQNNADYNIEYLDKETNNVIGSCKYIDGSPNSGITLKQNESIITIKRFIDGFESKTEEVHVVDLLSTLPNF